MKHIPEYEKEYTIEENGAVTRIESQRVIQPSINKQTGYLYVSLWKNNIGKTYSVHRLVAQVFLPNPQNLPVINHIDSNRINPHKDNLEWVSQADNIQHGYDFGFMTQEEVKNFNDFELDLILRSVLAGESLTSIATKNSVGLSRLSINVKNKAKELSLLQEYLDELKRQKTIRNQAAAHVSKNAILQYTSSGDYITEFDSITSATKALGKKSSGSISNALNPSHPQKFAYGYLWKFK